MERWDAGDRDIHATAAILDVGLGGNWFSSIQVTSDSKHPLCSMIGTMY